MGMHRKEGNSLYSLSLIGPLTGQLQYALKATIREAWGPQVAPWRVFGPRLVEKECLPEEEISKLSLKQVLGK